VSPLVAKTTLLAYAGDNINPAAIPGRHGSRAFRWVRWAVAALCRRLGRGLSEGLTVAFTRPQKSIKLGYKAGFLRDPR
jgi:hypothetical protein